MGELSRRGVKAFAVLSFMAFTSCAIAGRGAFHLFTPPSRYAARAMQPTIRVERSHLSCGTEPRAPLNDVSQRGHMRRAEAEAKAMAIGNIADVWRINTTSPLQKRIAAAEGNISPESAASVALLGGESLLCKAKGWGLVANKSGEVVMSGINSKARTICARISCGFECHTGSRKSRV